MINTTGYIYFAIKTENDSVDLDLFKRYIDLEPTKFQKMRSKNGIVPVCTSWNYSTDNLINPISYKVIENLIKELIPFKEGLINLKKDYPEFYFVLEVVLTIGDESPALSFNKDVLNFLNEIEAEIDCDLYNAK